MITVARPPRPFESPLGAHPHTVPGTAEPASEELSFPWTEEGIHGALAAYQDQLPDWRYGEIDLAAIVRRLRTWLHDLWATFIPKVWKEKVILAPPILLKFEHEHPRTLGHYCRGRNDLGLRWEISINPRHLHRETEVQLAATGLHENLHCFEDLAGVAPRSRNNYHSVLFRRLAEEWGIPSSQYGARLGIREDSPFMNWARVRGLSGDPVAVVSAPRRRSVPKRKAWACACPSTDRVQVLVARGSSLAARCERCGQMFRTED